MKDTALSKVQHVALAILCAEARRTGIAPADEEAAIETAYMRSYKFFDIGRKYDRDY